eukprot:108513_1
MLSNNVSKLASVTLVLVLNMAFSGEHAIEPSYEMVRELPNESFIFYVMIKASRAFRWFLPVIIGSGLYFGPLFEEFVSDTVSFRAIEENPQIIPVLSNTEKAFPFIDYNTFTAHMVTIRSNTTNISSEVLDQILLRWLVKPDGMEQSESVIEDKVNLLLKVSSPDFWAKNFYIHPKQSRVSWWMWVHGRYLFFVRRLQKINDRNELLKAFNHVSRKLQKHSHYEEVMLYPFLADNYNSFQLSGTDEELKLALESMAEQHIPIHKQEEQIVEAFKDKTNNVNDLKQLLRTWQSSLEAHFLEEEQRIVHLILKFDNAPYKRYLYYISWGYCMHAAESFIDYCLNLMYIT